MRGSSRITIDARSTIRRKTMTIKASVRYAVGSIMIFGLIMGGCKSAPKPATAVKGPVQGTLNPDGTFTANTVQPGQQGTLNSDGTFTPSGSAPGSSAQPVAPPTSMTGPTTASRAYQQHGSNHIVRSWQHFWSSSPRSSPSDISHDPCGNLGRCNYY